jgi:hypothetical protein
VNLPSSHNGLHDTRTRVKSVTELYGRHPGSDIYVIGTGPSLRVLPPSFLDGRITIGLNMAWKTVPVMYGITIHPSLNIPELMDAPEAHPNITWVTKEKFSDLDADQIRYAHQTFYFFRSDGKPNTRTDGLSDHGRVPEWLREPTDGFLYLWTSIAQAGVNLAANMGAKNIIVVACDNAALGGNHHATSQHTRWLGGQPEDRYREYYEGLAEARLVLRERGINVVSLNPFVTLGEPDDDFRRLCSELGVPASVKPGRDVSPKRPTRWRKARRRAGRLVRKVFR